MNNDGIAADIEAVLNRAGAGRGIESNAADSGGSNEPPALREPLRVPGLGQHGLRPGKTVLPPAHYTSSDEESAP